MAANEQRRVSIKINGKEVANDIRSIEKEFYRLRAEVKKVDRGSKEYRNGMKELRRVDGMLRQHRNELRGVSQESGKLSKMPGILRGAIAPFAAFFAGGAAIFKGIQTIREYNVALDELQAITGLSGDALKQLEEKAKQNAVQFGKSATQILEAYKLVGSAKPELLKDAEALDQVTRSALTLSKATGSDLSVSVQNLTQIMNQNGAAAEEADRYLNVLAAGSQRGAKEVEFLADAMKNLGPTGKSAGLSIEQQTGVLELFGEKGVDASKAGTQFRNILLELQKDQRNYTDGQFDFNKAVGNLKPVMNDAIELTNIFGKENVVGAQILAQNIDRYEELTDAVTGTSTAYEQAAINMDNFDTSMQRMGAAWDNIILRFSESDGILKGVVDELTQILNVSSEIIKANQEEPSDTSFWGYVIKGATGAGGLEMIQKQTDAAYQAQFPFLKQQKEIQKLSEEERANYEKARIEIRKKQEAQHKADKTATGGIVALNQRYTELNNLIQQAGDSSEVLVGFGRGASKLSVEDLKLELAATEQVLNAEKERIAEAKKAEQMRQAGESSARIKMEKLQALDVELLDSKVNIEQIQLDLHEKTLEEIGKMEDEFAKEQAEKEKERLQELKDFRIEMYQLGSDTVFQLADMASSEQKNRELLELEDRKQKGLISEEKYQQEREKIEKKAFQRKKVLDIAQALINGALAITKVTAQTGVLAPTVIPGIIASTASQVALIAAQKYEDGGVFLHGPSHRERGMPVIDPRTGQIQAELEGGEYITRKSSVNARTMPILRYINQTGDVPQMNYRGAQQAVRFEQGGQFGGGASQSGAVDNSGMYAKMLIEEVRMWQRDFRVSLPLTDLDDATDRRGRVEKIADVA